MGIRAFKNKISKVKLVAIDSMIFIYEFGEHKTYFSFVHELFNRLEKGRIKAITSLISFIEVTSFPRLQGKDKILKDYRQVFLKTPNLKMINPDLVIGEKTAEIRRNYRLRAPDAIQIATAIVNKADIFISNDKSFKKVKEIKTLVLKDFV